ncbi:phage tail tape measure protein [Oceanibium sediminis]|uniref:phage tail tape measure protein n=1 Tax=Oceanibium sediminis TaxID=2026339 RepID=UPI000DD49A22|nr:phage tail tape measure protein [Oceanibium sediminis]
MADLEDDFARLEGTIAGLETSLNGAESMTTAFRSEMQEVTSSMRVASQDASALSRTLGTSLKSAMTGLILDGRNLSAALSGVGQRISGSVLNAALSPVTGAISQGVNSLFGGYFAKGGVINSGQVQRFASGGIVDGATSFAMRGGKRGVMGEAGPEAIMPLTRGADGKLGVRGGGGGNVQVTMNISTPDVAGFQRSRSQIAAQVARAIGQGRRNQ